MFLQFSNRVDEVTGFLETSINTGKTHVGDLVNLAQPLHHSFSEGKRRHFTVELLGHFIQDFTGEFIDGLGADGSLLTCLAYPSQELFARKLFGSAIALDDHQAFVLDLFVGREAVPAGEALPPATDGRAFFGSSRVDHFIFLPAALGATHIPGRTTPKCGTPLIAYQRLWRQRLSHLSE